jgi:RimJ/RimL family protein N-acetyltransferase
VQCGLKNLSAACIGFAIGKSFRNEGFAFEAVSKIMIHLRGKVGTTNFQSETHWRNKPAKTLLSKLGFYNTKEKGYYKGSQTWTWPKESVL